MRGEKLVDVEWALVHRAAAGPWSRTLNPVRSLLKPDSRIDVLVATRAVSRWQGGLVIGGAASADRMLTGDDPQHAWATQLAVSISAAFGDGVGEVRGLIEK